MKKHILDTILNDAEKFAVQQFIDNDLQREAVKKCILAGLYSQGVLENGEPHLSHYNAALSLVSVDGKDTTNEKLGADLRALWYGLNNLEVAFSNMATFTAKDDQRSPNKENPAV